MNTQHLRLLATALIMISITSCSSKKMRQVTSSMEPTIKKNEIISVDFNAYSSKPPNRWDVVLFEAPIKNQGQWIKRVVGLPGEVVDFTSAGMTINGSPISSPPLLSLLPYSPPNRQPEVNSYGIAQIKYPYTIPSGQYFVIGDNAQNSLDSRHFGAIDEKKVLGKVRGK
jgi:signal peptidase I